MSNSDFSTRTNRNSVENMPKASAARAHRLVAAFLLALGMASGSVSLHFAARHENAVKNGITVTDKDRNAYVPGCIKEAAKAFNKAVTPDDPVVRACAANKANMDAQRSAITDPYSTTVFGTVGTLLLALAGMSLYKAHKASPR